MNEDEVMQLLRDQLRIDIDSTEVYTGNASLYEQRITVKLFLDGEVISEATL